MLADRQPPFWRATARTGPVIDRIGFRAGRGHDEHEALNLTVADEVGGCSVLSGIDNPLGDLCLHRAPVPRYVGTISAPEIVSTTVYVGF